MLKSWRVLTSISCLGLLWETSGPTQTVSASPSVLFCIIISRIHFFCTDFSFSFPFPFWMVPVPSHFPFDPPPKRSISKKRKKIAFFGALCSGFLVSFMHSIVSSVWFFAFLALFFFFLSPFSAVWRWGVFQLLARCALFLHKMRALDAMISTSDSFSLSATQSSNMIGKGS